MYTLFIKIAACLAMVGVILGAFAAHALKSLVTDTTTLSVFETGVRYHLYHALALLLVGILYSAYPNIFIKVAGYLFIAGIVLFSGSLYLLTYIKATAAAQYLWVGAITPLGGLCFIAGWATIAVGVSKR